MLGNTMRLPPWRRTNDNFGSEGETTWFMSDDEVRAWGAREADGASMSSSRDCKLPSLSSFMLEVAELDRVMSEGGSTPVEAEASLRE
jgi:hypothetical protein